jgi:trans-aconitate methyltransferase
VGTDVTEWKAAEYARRSQLQAAMAREVLALIDLAGSERVLDVGCGDGKITAQIAARVLQGAVVGVDPSRDMIAFAASHFPRSMHANLRFEVADARLLSYRDEFDFVVSFNALHWIPDQDAALQSVRATMKPAARAQLRLVPTGERKSLEAVVEETRRSSRWMQYFSGFHDPYLRLTPEQYASAAERNGFRVERIHTEAKAWDFESRDAFFAFCAVGLVEWTRRLPADLSAAFIDDVLDRYRTLPGAHPGEDNAFKFYQMDVTLIAALATPRAQQQRIKNNGPLC